MTKKTESKADLCEGHVPVCYSLFSLFLFFFFCLMGLIVNVPGGSEVQFQIRKRAMVKILTDNLATK
jgi:hypothetical protein